MPNPFVKLWKYLMASADQQIDEQADPKIQIQQAIEEAQRQHAGADPAGRGRHRQPAPAGDEARPADRARSRSCRPPPGRRWSWPTRPGPAGDEAKAAEYEQTAQAFATQLVRGRAVDGGPQGAARPGAAGRRAGQEGRRDQRRCGCRRSWPSAPSCCRQLEQAKMQEQVSASLPPDVSELSAPGNTPSLDEVRDKIEPRYANALGQAELAQNSVEGRMLEVQKSTHRRRRRLAAGRDPGRR